MSTEIASLSHHGEYVKSNGLESHVFYPGTESKVNDSKNETEKPLATAKHSNHLFHNINPKCNSHEQLGNATVTIIKIRFPDFLSVEKCSSVHNFDPRKPEPPPHVGTFPRQDSTSPTQMIVSRVEEQQSIQRKECKVAIKRENEKEKSIVHLNSGFCDGNSLHPVPNLSVQALFSRKQFSFSKEWEHSHSSEEGNRRRDSSETARNRPRLRRRHDCIIRILELLDWQLLRLSVGPLFAVFVGMWHQNMVEPEVHDQHPPLIMYIPIIVLLLLVLVSISTGLLLYWTRFRTTSTLHGLWYFNSGTLRPKCLRHLKQPRLVIFMVCASFILVVISVAMQVQKLNALHEKNANPLLLEKIHKTSDLSWFAVLWPLSMACLFISIPSFIQLLSTTWYKGDPIAVLVPMTGFPLATFFSLLGLYLDKVLSLKFQQVLLPIWGIVAWVAVYPFLKCALATSTRRGNVYDAFLEGAVIVGVLFPTVAFLYLFSRHIDSNGADVGVSVALSPIYMVLGLVAFLSSLSLTESTVYPQLHRSQTRSSTHRLFSFTTRGMVFRCTPPTTANTSRS